MIKIFNVRYLAFFVCVFSLTAIYAQNCKLIVTFEYVNIKEGYDHFVRDEILVDGVVHSTTKKHLSSKPLTIRLKKVNQGERMIQFNNYTLYKDKWETTSIKNGYNFNGTFRSSFSLGKKHTIHVIYDVDNPPSNPHVIFSN